MCEDKGLRESTAQVWVWTPPQPKTNNTNAWKIKQKQNNKTKKREKKKDMTAITCTVHSEVQKENHCEDASNCKKKRTYNLMMRR